MDNSHHQLQVLIVDHFFLWVCRQIWWLLIFCIYHIHSSYGNEYWIYLNINESRLFNWCFTSGSSTADIFNIYLYSCLLKSDYFRRHLIFFSSIFRIRGCWSDSNESYVGCNIKKRTAFIWGWKCLAFIHQWTTLMEGILNFCVYLWHVSHFNEGKKQKTNTL